MTLVSVGSIKSVVSESSGVAANLSSWFRSCHLLAIHCLVALTKLVSNRSSWIGSFFFSFLISVVEYNLVLI